MSGSSKSNDLTQLTAALGLILLGTMFFMGVGMLWPLFILVPGLAMIALALAGSKVGAATLSIPGALVAGLGGLLFVQNLTGYWASWAYAWTLFPVFVGLGLHVMARGLDDPGLHEGARWAIRSGLIAFALFGAFFEFVIGLGGIGSGGAALLILGGMFILYKALSEQPRLGPARDSESISLPGKAKRMPKRKNDGVLFTGPLVVGSCGRRDELARRKLARLDDDDDAGAVWRGERS